MSHLDAIFTLARFGAYLWLAAELIWVSFLYYESNRTMRRPSRVILCQAKMTAMLAVMFAYFTLLPIAEITNKAIYVQLRELLPIPVALSALAVHLFMKASIYGNTRLFRRGK